MIKHIVIGWIPGLMFGAEWDYEMGFIVLDIGIIRVVFDYLGFE